MRDINPVKILARRFVSLPPVVRMEISARLLRLSDGNPQPKSLLEEFWDEVEAAHGDELYPINPFAPSRPPLLLCAVKGQPPASPAYN